MEGGGGDENEVEEREGGRCACVRAQGRAGTGGYQCRTYQGLFAALSKHNLASFGVAHGIRHGVELRHTFEEIGLCVAA